jgi:cell division protein FtsN
VIIFRRTYLQICPGWLTWRVIVLLFVLWYCHKRGREVRLENERLVTEEEIRKLNEESSPDERIRATETLTTTAPAGASPAQIREGVKEAQQSRELATASASDDKQDNEETEKKEKENSTKPTRTKSRLSIFGRPSQKPAPKVEPYPGT